MATFNLNTKVEVWHHIPGLPGYQISNRFRVRKLHDPTAHYRKRFRFPKLHITDKGYLAFMANNRRVRIHHVVAEIVYGPRPEGMQVRHLDDNKMNNHPSNLAYGTNKDNVEDAIRNGRYFTPARREVQLKASAAAKRKRDLARGAWHVLGTHQVHSGGVQVDASTEN